MTLEVLARAIDEVEVAADAGHLRALIQLQDRLSSKVHAVASMVDAAELWQDDGATSMTAWLRSEGGLSSKAAARTTKTSARLARLPITAEAWGAGRLTSGQVEAIAQVVPPRLVEKLVDSEAKLIPMLKGLDPAQTVAALKHWMAHVDPDGPAPEEETRSLHISTVGESAGVITGNLGHVGAAIVTKAVDLALDRYSKDDPRTPSERRADALIDVCRFLLDHHGDKRAGRSLPHLNLLISAEDFAAGRHGQIIEGDTADPATVAQVACFGYIHRVLHSGRAEILEYGRGVRVVPAPLYNAVVIRDGHCRAPGCDRPASWCEVHHIWAWEDGGPTDMGNLVLLCSRHHHMLHKQKWKVELRPTSELVVTMPNGRVRTTWPPGALPYANTG